MFTYTPDDRDETHVITCDRCKQKIPAGSNYYHTAGAFRHNNSREAETSPLLDETSYGFDLQFCVACSAWWLQNIQPILRQQEVQPAETST